MVSGNAQSRRGNTLLQHGTVLRMVDINKMFNFLKINKQKADASVVKKAAGSLTSLQQELGKPPSFGQIEEALIEGLSGALPARFYEEGLTDAELQSAQQIAETWYATSDWTFQHHKGFHNPPEGDLVIVVPKFCLKGFGFC